MMMYNNAYFNETGWEERKRCYEIMAEMEGFKIEGEKTKTFSKP